MVKDLDWFINVVGYVKKDNLVFNKVFLNLGFEFIKSDWEILIKYLLKVS